MMKMKKLMLAVAFATAMTAMAETEKVGGYTWTYRINGDTAEIYWLYGYAAISPSPTGAVTIPSMLGGKPVTSIGNSAFYNCSGLTSVTIPNSVKSIGNSAFYNCSGLTSVTIPNSVKSIGDSAFSCSGLTSVAIPDSVTSIGEMAFYYCSGLESVTIPNSVTNIEYNAFDDTPFYDNQPNGLVVFGSIAYKVKGTCPSSITIPDGVTSIANSVFYGCSGLESVTIPNSVTSIGGSAFEDCSGLTSVTIPNSVTNIGSYAFSGCSGLTRVMIGNGVTRIGFRAFFDCVGLTAVHITDLAAWFRISFSFDSAANPLGYAHNLYLNGSQVKQLNIPNSVTSIGGFAFYGCSGLESVTIPNSVTSIGDGAFSGCSGLMSFVIDSDNSNYSSANGLLLSKDGKTLIFGVNGNVTIPGSVTSIGSSAFWGCSGLTSVTIPNSVTSIESSAFWGCSGLTSVTIPNSVTNIGSYAFYNCNCLTGVTIPDGVTSIGSQTFGDCSGLTSVTIPNSVASIGYMAFEGCSGLTSVTIPDSVTRIEDRAFYGCSGLTSVTIPASVTSIGDVAFWGCCGLTNITVPQYVLNRKIASVFLDSPITNVAYSSIITSISAYAFSGCSGLTSVSIPDSVTSIGAFAFDRCSGLTSVTIPDSVTSIGNGAFFDCSGLTSVTIPNSVTNIGSSAFAGCSELNSLVFLGNAPAEVAESTFNGVAPDCCAYVCPSSTGWGVDIPGTWFGIAIDYIHYNVTFDANGGEGGGVMSVAYGSSFVPPEVTRKNYRFVGWFTEADGGEPVPVGTTVSDAMLLYAHWEVLPDVWFYEVVDGAATVTWYSTPIGDIEIPSVLDGYHVTAIADDAFGGCTNLTGVTIPASVTSIGGYAFHGCSGLTNLLFMGNAPAVGNNAFSGVHETCAVYVLGPSTGWDVDIPGTWNGIAIGYVRHSVALDANGGMCVTNLLGAVHGMPIGTLPVPTRENATFIGWFTESASGRKVNGSMVVTNDMSLFAHWLHYPVVASEAGTEFRTDSCVVTITCATEGAVIYFTDDGSTPKKNNEYRYSGPITITDTTTFKAVAVVDGISSGYVTATITKRALSLEEALNVSLGISVATSATLPWKPVFDSMAKVGDATAQSGAIGNKTNTWLAATVSGAGTMTFWCKVSCEHDEDDTFTWDRLMVYTNGVEIVAWRMDGESGWTQREVSFAGGENTVKWVYFKDKSDSAGEDCAWVDGITWTSSAGGGLASWLAERNLTAKSRAANGRTAAECYALGLDPALATNDFRIVSIEMVDSQLKVEWEPKTNCWTGAEIPVVLKGAESLDGEWHEVDKASESDKAKYRFFKVVVELP